MWKHLVNFSIFEELNVGGLLSINSNQDLDLISLISSLKKSGRILEIACGNGSDAVELDKRGYDIICTDINKDYVDYVNAQGIECHAVDTKEGFPMFRDNEFDIVYSRLGLHYFTASELSYIFKDIHRVCKSSGFLVFTVKMTNNIQTAKIIFDKEKWIEIVESAGFSISSIEDKDGDLYGIRSQWIQVVATKS